MPELTRERIMAMGPKELNRAVAERVIGCHVIRREGSVRPLYDLVIPGQEDRIDFVSEFGAWRAVPDYSTGIAAAWTVVDHFGAMWMDHTAPGEGIDVEFKDGCTATADTAPLAICRAALIATLGEGGDAGA